jgi:hypothetical protein
MSSAAVDINNAALPTLERLGVSAPKDVDAAVTIAQAWFDTFANHVQTGDVDGILRQLVDDAFWRDILSLTWDFRTFYGNERIQKFLTDRLAISKLSIRFSSTQAARPYRSPIRTYCGSKHSSPFPQQSAQALASCV